MKNTNRLIRESSPYLLQHAHNPVDWYAWGEEAISRAKAENKPILLSIGYAACHWCHVMAHESFEDSDTAALMNKWFINIKVDREERPDLDHIYMDALQTMTGSGGWPLNIFLTPELKPFYGGTYFPPVAAYQRPSWKELLQSVAKTFEEHRDDIEQQASQMLSYLKQSNQFGSTARRETEPMNEQELRAILQIVMKSADRQYGGFGKAPKFPSTATLQFLMRYLFSNPDVEVEQQLRLTLDQMRLGGIYDQLGGGFSRYATDQQWMVPHFEKMLYDNALLASCYAEAYQLYQDPHYLQVLNHTLEFVRRELRHPDGGWYTALDADSEGVEGAYYTWNLEEIQQILGTEVSLFCEYYHVTKSGNWEERNILYCTEDVEVFAAKYEMDPSQLESRLQHCRVLLMRQRTRRTAPQTDTKRLLSTNSLMVTAYLKAYAASGIQSYLDEAQKGLHFIRTAFQNPGKPGLAHLASDGRNASQQAFLDDYACYLESLILAASLTGELTYLKEARALTLYVIQHFGDENQVYFYFTPSGQSDVIVRKREMYDGSTPSGNAMMAANLWKMSVLVGESEWGSRAWRMVHDFAETIARYPTSFAFWANVLWDMVHGTAEIALLGSDAAQAGNELARYYLGGSVWLFAAERNDEFPLLARKVPDSNLAAYLCRNFECQVPVYTLTDLIGQYERFNRRIQESQILHH